LRHALGAVSAASAAVVFVAFFFYEKPGLGIGHFYYVSILLAALATGPWAGAAAGVVATALFAIDVVITPRIPAAMVLTDSTAIRFVTFVTVGLVTGYFAKRNRLLVSELEVLAERDVLTGLPNTRAFERAITSRLEQEQPFGLLVGDIDSFARRNETDGRLYGDDVLRAVADRLMRALDPGDEVARVGGDEFAILTYARGTDDAARVAASLQRLLGGEGLAVTFGWAAYPQDGKNALSLYRAADERLYARKVIRGERRENLRPVESPPSASAGA
jgi:diguanylate cyclase